MARNRAAIIRAAQLVIANHGSDSSIDLFAEQAEVSISTLYKHFENKEALILEAFAEAFRRWEEDSDLLVKGVEDPLEELVAPMRLILRLRETHPLYAQMVERNFAQLPKYLWKIEEGLTAHIYELLGKGILNFDLPEIRVRLISACLYSSIGIQIRSPDATEADADAAIEVILGLLQIPEATAKNLARAALPKPAASS